MIFLQRMRNKIIKQDNEDTERAKTIQSSINRGFHSTTGTLDPPKNVSVINQLYSYLLCISIP